MPQPDAASQTAELILAAQAGFDDAQKRAGTADIVARVRRMPNGTVDVVWNRRSATEQRLRIGTVSGAHPALANLAKGITKSAPKGHLYILMITAADDSDAKLVIAPRRAGTPRE